jgi:uncharacterized protein (DUF433 family)
MGTFLLWVLAIYIVWRIIEWWADQDFGARASPASAPRHAPASKLCSGPILLPRHRQSAQSAVAAALRIEIIMPGKPVIRGSWIPVELVLRKLGEGATDAGLLAAYPDLTPEDIRAAMLFAANALGHLEAAGGSAPSRRT